MKIDIPLIDKIHDIIVKSKVDPLVAFVAMTEVDKLENIQKKNFSNFILLCKEHKVRYVYLGHSEICGCENIRDKAGWPAIWDIARKMGYPGSCGNGDQYQAMDPKKIYYPPDAYGHWDLLENRKLSKEEIRTLKFKHVVDRKFW